MDIGVFRGIVTGVLLLLFLGLIGWAWSRKRKSGFDAAAREPLNDGAPPQERRP